MHKHATRQANIYYAREDADRPTERQADRMAGRQIDKMTGRVAISQIGKQTLSLKCM